MRNHPLNIGSNGCKYGKLRLIIAIVPCPGCRRFRLLVSRVFGFALLLSGLSDSLIGQIHSSTVNQLVLTGCTIYPSTTESPIPDGVLIIRDGKIAEVGRRGSVRAPEGATTLDCSGLTVTAGFWNSHVHFFERKWADAANIPAPELAGQLQDMLTRYGFTSVFDLGSPWENTRRLRDRIESGEVAGPRIHAAGLLVPPGFVPSDQVLNVLGVMKTPGPEISDAVQAKAGAGKLLEEGVDGIKLHSVSDESIVQAVVNEAHRSGKPVFVHPGSSSTALLAAIRGGVDVVAHTTPYSPPWDEKILAVMKERRVAVMPTLMIWKYLRRHDRKSAQEQFVNVAIGQLRAWLAIEGTVLFGTDVGAVDYDPVEEYALMAEAGMNFRQILASLTTAPAERFGESKRLGRIAPGFVADLVILNGDPSKDVRQFANVRYTIRDGKVIYQGAK